VRSAFNASDDDRDQRTEGSGRVTEQSEPTRHRRGQSSVMESVAPEEASLEELRVALDGLRREIRTRRPHDEGTVQAADPIDWLALFEELRHRFANLGMSDRVVDIDEFGLDRHVVERLRPALDLLRDRYWRIESHGLRRVPSHGPFLAVANRSGLLPYDGLMLAHILEHHSAKRVRPRFLVADWLATLPFAQPRLAKLGGVRACRENADHLLRTGRPVLAFPEGVKGAAKTFSERYQMKRFGRGGVVRAAIENGVPLVPVGIVGPEEAHPILFKSHRLARPLGLPFVPVTPTFPLLGPLGLLPLPTKWVINFGDPIDLPPQLGADEQELLVSRLTEELRAKIQQLVNRGLDQRNSVWS
jgi:1-acyl-sn-glycerol-3-phosphate acyltransferase